VQHSRSISRNLALVGGVAAALFAASPALAVGGLPNATPVADRVDGLYNLIFWITFIIFLGVWCAMAYILVKYRHRPGRQAIQTHGNTALEIVWTVIPALILIAIAIPTYQVLNYEDKAPNPDMTVQAIGHQWFWEYKYPDQKLDFSNQDLVIPANKVVKVLVSSVDVIHDWAVPEFGFKLDAIPGHVNEGWVYAKKPGDYDGYCMQLCGALHAKMLTHVKALPEAEYVTWLHDQQKAAGVPETPAFGVVAQPPSTTGVSAETTPSKVAAAPAKPALTSPAALKAQGEKVYGANCASCHQANGQGLPGTFPPLAGSEYTNGAADKHIQTVLKGLNGSITVLGKPYNGAMPPWAQLTDDDLAAVITYERTSWGNHGSVVTSDQVKAQRGK